MFAALYAAGAADAARLLKAARAFSPRVEQRLGGRLVLIDAAGLGRVIGDAHAIAAELRQLAGPVATGMAVAPTRTAALLLAAGGAATGSGDAVVLPGGTAAAVGALDLHVFHALARPEPWSRPGRSGRSSRPCALCLLCTASHARARALCGQPGGACAELPTLDRWGLRTLGDLAALPAADLASRLGQTGVALQQLARGIDTQPLVPVVEEARFEASLDLEWPIDDLQPLSFVLTRLLEPLSVVLERADRGAAAIVTELTLVTIRSDPGAGRKAREVHARRLELPAPMREARVLRTLILLDLESHPPHAGIDRVTVRLEPTPGRIVQFSLLERAGPQPETTATLVSRLTALMGEGRVGSPGRLDSHVPDSVAVLPFGETAMSRHDIADHQISNHPITNVLRRFRLPVAARVVFEHGRPVRVTTDRFGIKGGAVEQSAGPWRSSGWSACAGEEGRAAIGAWDRDEYDVALADGAAYRIYRSRDDNRWFIDGILD